MYKYLLFHSVPVLKSSFHCSMLPTTTTNIVKDLCPFIEYLAKFIITSIKSVFFNGQMSDVTSRQQLDLFQNLILRRPIPNQFHDHEILIFTQLLENLIRMVILEIFQNQLMHYLIILVVLL